MTRKLKRQILTALDKYSELLESAIECHTVPGTSEAVPAEQPILADLRKKWRRVEDIKIALQGVKAE